MELALHRGDFFYDLVLWFHLLTAIVGFGSSFVWPFYAGQARTAGPAISLWNSRTSLRGSPYFTTYMIYAVGLTGILLIIVSDGAIEFSDAWISIAFLLYIVALVVSLGFHYPNLKAMLTLQEELENAPPSAGGPPPQVAELAERGKKAGMYGGILHLLFVLILLDMVFRP